MEDKIMKAMIEKQRWTKTNYGGQPHEYIVDKWNPMLFMSMRKRIVEKGYSKKFKDGQKYQYYEMDGYKYWVVQCILNREVLNAEKTD